MKYCDQCRSSYPNEFKVCPMDNSPLRLTSELFPGITIRDKYLILEKVGEGGMGAVYRARHLAFNEIRALKVVHASFAEDRGFIRRFKTEAIVARRLQHPNAVRIDDLDSTEDGRPFIVMEMIEGCNLKTLITQVGVFPMARALAIAAQTADALAAAHKLGIVHRDIKPDNILISSGPDGSDLVKVADFGIAKVHEGAIDVGSGYTVTRSGMIVGTPQYLSPEQAMGMQGEDIDGRADMYSLGIVLYMMLTGQLPFASDTPMGFLMHHVQTKPVAPHVIRPDLDIPPELSVLLMKALEKDRNRRFSSAEEMAYALRHVSETAQQTRRFAPLVSQKATPAADRPHYRGAAAAPARAPEFQAVAVKTPTPRDLYLEQQRFDSELAQPAPKQKPTWIWVATGSAVLIAAILGSLYHLPYLRAPRETTGKTAAHAVDGTTQPPPKPPVSVVSDSDIHVGVQQGVASLKGCAINVAVQTGVVTLSGRCGAKMDSVQAENVASGVNGVKVVRNDIQVDTENLPTVISGKDGEPGTNTKSPPAKKPASAKAEQPKKKVDPAEVESLISAGKQAWENGEYDKATKSYQTALNLDPQNAAAKTGLVETEKARKAEEQVPH